MLNDVVMGSRLYFIKCGLFICLLFVFLRLQEKLCSSYALAFYTEIPNLTSVPFGTEGVQGYVLRADHSAYCCRRS